MQANNTDILSTVLEYASYFLPYVRSYARPTHVLAALPPEYRVSEERKKECRLYRGGMEYEYEYGWNIGIFAGGIRIWVCLRGRLEYWNMYSARRLAASPHPTDTHPPTTSRQQCSVSASGKINLFTCRQRLKAALTFAQYGVPHLWRAVNVDARNGPGTQRGPGSGSMVDGVHFLSYPAV